MTDAPQDDGDYIGYGDNLPDAQWPDGARIALNISVHFEGGGEPAPMPGSLFEYGSRVGGWRLLKLFRRYEMKVCLRAVARATEANTWLTHAYLDDGHELVSGGYRWLDYRDMPEAEEREQIGRALDTFERACGVVPVGWMTGRPSPNTRRLLAETGRLLYDRDAFNDELPYWQQVAGKPHLVIPSSFEANDDRFEEHRGFAGADDFARTLIDCFDVLYAEGDDRPRLMSLAVHDRIMGRPGRVAGLVRFFEHVRRHHKVWVATGREIAEHWQSLHPPPTWPADVLESK